MLDSVGPNLPINIRVAVTSASIITVTWTPPSQIVARSAEVLSREIAMADSVVWVTSYVGGMEPGPTAKCPIATGICAVSGLPGDKEVSVQVQVVSNSGGVSDSQLFEGVITWSARESSEASRILQNRINHMNPRPSNLPRL